MSDDDLTARLGGNSRRDARILSKSRRAETAFMPPAPKHARRWLALPRFGISVMLVAVGALACGTFAAVWYYRLADARAAMARFDQVRGNLEWDVASPVDVCAASEELLTATLKVPFTNRRAAQKEHLERVQKMRDRAKYTHENALWADPDGSDEYARDIVAVVNAYYEKALNGAAQ